MNGRFRVRELVGRALTGHYHRKVRRFLDATERCRDVQHDVLRGLLNLNADSRFSRQRGLDGSLSVAEFRRRMPVSDYELVREHVEQVRQGDFSALLGSANRLLMFSLTSGTTSESKFIPITQRFLDDYRRGWQMWGIRSFQDHPKLHRRNLLQMSSDYEQFHTPAGTPCGNISGLVSAMQSPIVRTLYCLPNAVARIRDSDAKRYVALRLSVCDEAIGLVMTANPGTLIQFARFGNDHRQQLIRDIHNGTLSTDFNVPNDIRSRLHHRVRRRNATRARQLDRIVESTGRLYPAEYWPGLELLGVWTGGSARAYVPLLEEYYGRISVRDHGLHASEGRMTVPLADATASGVLELQSHFFEFIPEDDADSEVPDVLEAHELQEGRTYFILLTTASGLYRYNIRDVVRCTGFQGTTPLLEFLHKGAHISSVTGEKLSESQVVSAVTNAAHEMNLRFEYFTITPVWDRPPHYRLFVNADCELNEGSTLSLASLVDRHLRKANCEYEEKRETQRLQPVDVQTVPLAHWERFVESRTSRRGGSVEQYKHPCLIPDPQFEGRFLNALGGLAEPTARAGSSVG